MKKFDLVKLINSEPYKTHNLKDNMHGMVINTTQENVKVMFFNEHNIGDYIVVDIAPTDLMLEKLPKNLESEMLANLDSIVSNAKDKFTPQKIKAYDRVELLVEAYKYSMFGIHKGEIGCVMDDEAVQNCIEVDFSGIDENGEYYGDCISVNINDLKVIE